MSDHSKVRRLARSRMSETGEKYTKALRTVRADADSGRSDHDQNESVPVPITGFNPFDPTADNPVDLEWPEGLVRPASPPYLVYLDLNHWIGLAQANTGNPAGSATSRSSRLPGPYAKREESRSRSPARTTWRSPR